MLDSILITLVHQVIGAKRALYHHHRRLGMVEVCHKGIRHAELVRREYELVGPPLKLLEQAIGSYGTLRGTGGTHTNRTDTMTRFLSLVDDITGLLVDEHLFRR